MKPEPPPPATLVKQVCTRLLLILGGLLFGLFLAEIALKVSGQPRFYKPHTSPPQFMFGEHIDPQTMGYLNKPSSSIRFQYDGDPRGYFGPENEVSHRTNAIGFRGHPFPFDLDQDGKEVLLPKPPQTIRLAFLGDSFTFGEGVHDDDTFAQVTAVHLQKRWPDRMVEAANYGVSGYNINQSFHVLQRWTMKTEPDAVILGFVLNDAEPPIFTLNPLTGRPFQGPLAVEQGRFGTRPPGRLPGTGPPDRLWYRSNIIQLVWRFRIQRQQTHGMVTHYRSLYTDTNPSWKTNRAALLEIVETCQQDQIPCYVVLFPELYELNENYPFKEVHEHIQKTLAGTHATFIDLFPLLAGKQAADLWVHPTDHHPNNEVHALVGKTLAEHLARDLSQNRAIKERGR
ncbi:MAG: SGNH/GDSL hydrolase family protein [Planctomycetota bacterium]|nr:SGNH/GDSL hydrolase family protein [Planctomycetota bacterium]